MKKPEENNTQLLFFHGKRISMLFLGIVFMLQACEKTGENHENAGNFTGNNRVMAQEQQPSAREVILIRGNEWIHGIPCFEDNSFPALTGEYNFLAPEKGAAAETGEEKRFLVYVCPESLYFSKEWQPRAGTGSIVTYQQNAEECFFIAAILDDGMGSSWTAVFRFPPELEESVLTGDTFNQMLRVWSNRFFYFLYLARNRGELSIPAVVEF